ncbi:MAG: hypothetical protein HYW06_02455 [Gemmatimonadetes bacterium]|nr:hypothetical protein [Gemmatimonadota bacterium]MBI2614988.1 hypothetical protein [Gemmatimonadota bacterium]
MDAFMIVLRLLHVALGVFWAGALFFLAWFLIPSVRDAGPDGAKVVQALQQRGFMNILPAAALLTILSGLILYWRVSGGFQPAWSRSPTGMSLGIGAVASIVGFGIGVGVMRPATLRANALSQTLGQLTEASARDARMAEIQGLRLRAARAARWVASLLLIAVITMAVARYL